jgi:uncharacterized membrane protein
MAHDVLLLIIFGTAFICYALERRIAWMSHVSGVCLLILVAMVLSQLGIVPSQAFLYDFFQGPLLLIGLVLMTLGLQLQDVVKIPLKILVVFAIGTFGSVVGGLVAGWVGSHSLGIEGYHIAAQLTASYIGGGENAAAMQKIYNIPHNYFVAVFAVDNIVTSLWMMFTIWFANDKHKEVPFHDLDATNFDGTQVDIIGVLACLFISMFLVFVANFAAEHIGGIHKILWLSLLSIACGQIPILRDYFKSSYILGVILFTGFFFSIGASSDIQSILNLPASIIYMPFLVVLIHAAILLPCAYFLKVSRISTMVASQALIGGPATAVAIAQTRKWKSGISIGIVLGVLGYAIANFFGTMVFQILQFFHPL